MRRAIYHTALILTFILSGLSARGHVENSDITSVDVFGIGEEGSKYYRIPAVVRATDGTLVAVADQRRSSKEDLSLHPEGIRLVAKLSHDNGRTWSALFPLFPDWTDDAGNPISHGDAALALYQPTGDLVCVFCSDESYQTADADRPGRIYVSTSADNGRTWRTPVRIDAMLKAQIDSAHTATGSPLRFFTGFAASGNMLSTPDGLLFALNGRHVSECDNPSRGYEYVCYLSADNYRDMQWQVLNPASPVCADGSGNESKIASPDGDTLLMSIRTPGRHRLSRSDDFGATWSAPYPAVTDDGNGIPEPGCNGGFLRYTSANTDCLFLTVPARTVDGVRSDVTLYRSDDGGSRWHRCRTISDGPSAYSTLCNAGDNRLGILVECGDDRTGYTIRYITLPASSLTSVKL